jgi:ABC-type glycerol-3-phosphate transport system substrate-binding protein
MSIYNDFKASRFLPWSEEQDGLLGAALPPGPSFVGGTNLVIWQHTSHLITQGALDLITLLVSSPQFSTYCLDTGYLPSRQDALDILRKQGDARMQVLVGALETGRTGSSAHLWVLVAERLGAALGGIWNALRQEPDQDVPDLVARMTRMAAARLEQSLS